MSDTRTEKRTLARGPQTRHILLGTAVGLLLALAPCASRGEPAMPRYAHIFVIIEENHTEDQIIGNPAAPNFNRLAKAYGLASNFYAERHPSEPNYVAMVGGDTFGIRDDDAFYCKPGPTKWGCEKSDGAGYVDHTIVAPNLASQLDTRGIAWKGYFEDIPEPGSLAYRWPSPQNPVAGKPDALYASKHNGFMNFKSVQDDPARAKKIVGFDALYADIAAGTLPAYAYIVPNQCDDMHGLKGHDVPPDCTKNDPAGLMGRADALLGSLTDKIMHSPVWQTAGNSAIVVTFDENDDERVDSHPSGCCGSVPGDANNPGGGWITTIVITNHGPRGVLDPSSYNHYSLLRTTEAAFGISQYLDHAADSAKGVALMTPLFAVAQQKP